MPDTLYYMHTTVVPLSELYLSGVHSTVHGYRVRAHLNLSPGWQHYSRKVMGVRSRSSRIWVEFGEEHEEHDEHEEQTRGKSNTG